MKESGQLHQIDHKIEETLEDIQSSSHKQYGDDNEILDDGKNCENCENRQNSLEMEHFGATVPRAETNVTTEVTPLEDEKSEIETSVTVSPFMPRLLNPSPTLLTGILELIGDTKEPTSEEIDEK